MSEFSVLKIVHVKYTSSCIQTVSTPTIIIYGYNHLDTAVLWSRIASTVSRNGDKMVIEESHTMFVNAFSRKAYSVVLNVVCKYILSKILRLLTFFHHIRVCKYILSKILRLLTFSPKQGPMYMYVVPAFLGKWWINPIGSKLYLVILWGS